VRRDDRAEGLRDLRGRVFACNSLHSNSGMNLPRRCLAELAEGRPLFRRVVMTGGHPASMALVRDGGADAAAIDGVTFACFADHRPDVTAGLRVLAETPPSPAIPFVTSRATTPATVAALRRALATVGADPRYATVRQGLRIQAIAAPEGSDYTLLLRYEAEAAALGYPELA
jgi:ABC-type phosphate/phosphonate transport system substrate-binding protein